MGQKSFGVKKNWVKKYGSKKSLGQKKFGVKKCLRQQNLWASTSAQTSNNFVINTCSTDHSTLKETKSVMIQTDTTREVIEEVVEVHDHPTNVPSSSPAL